MKLNDLAKYCETINTNCEKCLYKDNCEKLAYELEDISPFGLLKMVEENIDV